MFGNKEKTETDAPLSPQPSKHDKTVIGEGAKFNGNIQIDGNITINGEFEGTIACAGSLLVGKAGRVKGEIDAREASVAGRVEGRIFAKERVELQTGSHLQGDVHAKSFMIQDGVFFQGNCNMGEAAGTQSPPAESADGRQPDLGILKQN